MPDESTNGYNGQNQNGLKVLNYINSGHVPSHTTFLNGVRLGINDSQPDMFTFSLPGLSGRFFFDETQCGNTIKQATVIPHQKVSITGHFNYTANYNINPGIIEKFVIVDQKGVIYTFDILEKVAGLEQGDPEQVDFASSWYLSSIETPKGNRIDYHYRSRIVDLPPTVSESRTIPVTNNPVYHNGNTYNKRVHYPAISEAVLERISFRGGQVTFVEGDERLDWNSTNWLEHPKATEQPRTLAKVRVTVANKIIKETEFYYSYFGSSERLRLDSLKETNNGLSIPAYRFEYANGGFPAIGQENSIYQQDHWGFYRPTGQTTLLPPFFLQLPGLSIDIPGNSRESSGTSNRTGILTRLTYPTQGYTQFQYEPNDYWADARSGFNICAGTFLPFEAAGKSIATEGNAMEEKTITVTEKTCFQLTYQHLVPCVDGEALVALYEGAQVIAQHVVQRKIFGLVTTNYGPVEGQNFTLEPGTYTLRANVINENTCGQPTGAKVTLHKVEQTDGYANRIAGGQRIKSIRDCSNTSNCVSKVFYYRNPNNTSQSSGVLLNEPVYRYQQEGLFDDNFAQVAEIECVILSAQSQIPLATASGGVIGYSYVTVSEGKDSLNGWTMHHFTNADNYADVGSTEYPFPPRTSNEWKRGLDMASNILRSGTQSSGEMISETARTYNINSSYFRTIAFKPKQLRISHTQLYIVGFSDFEFPTYNTQTGWARESTITESTYDYSDSIQRALTNTTTYNYGNPQHLLPTRIQTYSSAGDTIRTILKYVQDVSDIEGLSPSELSGIQSNPDKTALIEKKSYHNANLLSTARTIYDGIHMKKVLSSTGNHPFQQDFIVDEYDIYGNIVNATERNGVSSTFIYDSYRRRVIAQVHDASRSEVYYNSFEVGGVVSPAAKTGMAYHNGDFTFTPPTGFTPKIPSLLSYWYFENGAWLYAEQEYTGGTITLTNGDRIDELRILPLNATMVTYGYDGNNIVSINDTNNLTTYFEYDALGRLISKRDDDGSILTHYKYHLQHGD